MKIKIVISLLYFFFSLRKFIENLNTVDHYGRFAGVIQCMYLSF